MSDEHTNQPPQPPVPTDPTVMPETYADAALEEVRKAAKGNGVKPEDIKIISKDGGMAQFRATLSLNIDEKTLMKTIGGRKTTGDKVGNPQEARDAQERDRNAVTGGATETQIRNMVIEREDKGLGLKNELIRLPFLSKEYFWHEACRTCSSQGNLQCQRCHGKGNELCPRCNGQGQEVCTQCSGSQYIYNGSTKVQCLRCNGTGKTGCRLCNERRKIQCTICKGRGSTQCMSCGGQGWNSHIMMVEKNLIGMFDFDRAGMSTKLATTIEELGKDLAKYAPHSIYPQPAVNDTTIITIEYAVRLMHADVEFAFGEKHTAHIFMVGPNGTITDAASFIDAIIRPGMHELKEAAEKRGDIGDAIRRAGKYRTVRQGIILAAKNPPAKAAKILLKHNPLGLSDSAAKAIANDASLALKNVMATQKIMGMVFGVIAATALYAGYFLTTLRLQLLERVTNTMLHPPADAVIYGIGVAAAIFITQFIAAGALRKALHGLIPDDQKKSLLPRMGRKAYIVATICFVIFIGAIEATLHIGGHPPDWYLFMRTQITG